MNTVDELLKNIVDNNIQNVFTETNSKDKRVLVSLNKQIKSGYFLTERQGNLLIRILNNYRAILHSKNFFDIALLDTPVWGQKFRVINPSRKISLNDSASKIVLEFNYINDIKQLLYAFLSSCQGPVDNLNANKIEIPKNEKNILEVFKYFKSKEFVIDQRIVDLHEKIVKLLDQANDYLNIFSPANEKLLTKVNQEIVPDSEHYLIKLLDRRHRNQYSLTQENLENSLMVKLASRPVTNIFINEEHCSLIEIFDTLLKLDRLPVLLVFNNREVNECQKYLELLKTSLDAVGISTAGIYFRLDNNTENNKNFNTTISQYGYNSLLTDATSIAGIANGTLPKFLLKNKWKAKSVISFTNGFKNNKASVYASDIDLTIYYGTHKPFIGELYEPV